MYNPGHGVRPLLLNIFTKLGTEFLEEETPDSDVGSLLTPVLLYRPLPGDTIHP